MFRRALVALAVALSVSGCSIPEVRDLLVPTVLREIESPETFREAAILAEATIISVGKATLLDTRSSNPILPPSAVIQVHECLSKAGSALDEAYALEVAFAMSGGEAPDADKALRYINLAQGILSRFGVEADDPDLVLGESLFKERVGEL